MAKPKFKANDKIVFQLSSNAIVLYNVKSVVGVKKPHYKLEGITIMQGYHSTSEAKRYDPFTDWFDKKARLATPAELVLYGK